MCDNNKTDIHTHIISGVDDGAQNQEQMIQMLLTAKEQGINRIVATPHCYPGKNRYDLSYIQKCFQIAKNAALEIGIEMYLGSEVFYRYGLAEEIEKGEVLTMADSSYILVEFSPETSYRKI